VHEKYDSVNATSNASSDHQYAFEGRRSCFAPLFFGSSNLRFVYERLRNQAVSDKVDSEHQRRILFHSGSVSNQTTKGLKCRLVGRFTVIFGWPGRNHSRSCPDPLCGETNVTSHKESPPTATYNSKKSSLVGSCSLPVAMYATPYSLAGFICSKANPPKRSTML
jgi:hypothetical protein